MSAPAAHEWEKVGRYLYRCPWCGACRKSYRKPDPEALSQRDAQLQYDALRGKDRTK
ncbi:hypothetical protein PQS31_01805 [Luteimonas sp BLCC-B24]|nr:hypothetical protein [Luteimonas sp. BLCC-B24]